MLRQVFGRFLFVQKVLVGTLPHEKLKLPKITDLLEKYLFFQQTNETCIHVAIPSLTLVERLKKYPFLGVKLRSIS